jgi:hypothetical protein
MTPEVFDQLLNRRIKLTTDVLASKAGEYAEATDRLHNFHQAAKIVRDTAPGALLGFVTKHLVAIVDKVVNDETPTQEWVDEKIGDVINYMVLLEALWQEERENVPTVEISEVSFERTWDGASEGTWRVKSTDATIPKA